jgi:hypothetical protein
MTTIYEGYRSYIEVYSFYRSKVEAGNKPKAEQRFSLVMAEVLSAGYDIMENLRREVAAIAQSAAGDDTNAVEQFARATWDSTRAQLCAMELAILLILGISPQRASLAGILSNAHPNRPDVALFTQEELNTCAVKCTQLGQIAGVASSASIAASSDLPKEYVVPQWYLEGQLRAVISAMKEPEKPKQ